MSDLESQYALWDEFLQVWPATRLAEMTIDEYTKAGSQDTFTYWIESRLDKLGSIWGGSAFKFGVYSRKDVNEKKSDGTRSYSSTHAWYSRLGATAEEAFKKVRANVVAIAQFAAEGNLEAIEKVEVLGDITKWKIAFHYQDRSKLTVVDVFKKESLAIFAGGKANQSMAELQRLAMARRPDELGILEFGKQIWAKWSRSNLRIWKLSHGHGDFSAEDRQHYLAAKLALMHGETAKHQGEDFKSAPIGTLFYLCHGNQSLVLVGQFVSDPQPSDKGEGWLQRRYRVLKPAIKDGGYEGVKKGWAPNYNSTFKLVGADDLPEFESNLLQPFFGIDLPELAELSEKASNAGSAEGAQDVDDQSTDEIAPSGKAEKPRRAPFNRIYYGPPGTGKTYTANQIKRDYEQELIDVSTARRVSFVTFHQSYGYEEFVEGLRPVLGHDTETGDIRYEMRPGVFKELCARARRAPNENFAMVIDEINRGNISKIFGELITLIELDKRDPLDGGPPPVEVKLAYSGENFSVPVNVDIIGTMNTADRSLALLDTALRRRFDFVALEPDTREAPVPGEPGSAPLAGLVVTLETHKIDVRRMLEKLNERIEALYDRDHCIGHAYFTHLKSIEDGPGRFEALSATFRNRVIPLLEEYFFEDWQKIRLVLADNQKKDDRTHFILESASPEQDLTALFGDEHGLDAYALRRRYTLNKGALKHPFSYIGVYEPDMASTDEAIGG
jgi:5-methylcytosine-specific restriction endonuclease McrBC GTP-binding regulatory subunit McrB